MGDNTDESYTSTCTFSPAILASERGNGWVIFSEEKAWGGIGGAGFRNGTGSLVKMKKESLAFCPRF